MRQRLYYAPTLCACQSVLKTPLAGVVLFNSVITAQLGSLFSTRATLCAVALADAVKGSESSKDAITCSLVPPPHPCYPIRTQG